MSFIVTGTGDAAGASTVGTFKVDASGSAAAAVAIPANAVYGDSGTLVLKLSNGKATSSTVAVTDATAAPTPAEKAAATSTNMTTASGATYVGADGGNYSFNAVIGGSAPTLVAFNTVTGKGTGNSLNIVDQTAGKAAFPTGTNITGIQTVNLQTGGAGGSASAPFDVNAVGGATSLVVTTTGDYNNFLKASKTTNVTITETTGVGYQQVLGGKNITATVNNGVTVGNDTSSIVANTPVGAVVITDAGLTSDGEYGGTRGDIIVDGGTTVDITESGYNDIYVGYTLSPSGVVTITDTFGGNSIAVYGGASATITNSSRSEADAIDVAGVIGTTTIVQQGGNDSANVVVNDGTGVTLTTTGGSADIGVSSAIGGDVSITNTATWVASLDYQNVAGATGKVTITSTASSGAITVGSATAATSPSGVVTIVNQTGALQGSGTATVDVNAAPSVSVTGVGGGTTITDRALVNGLTAVTLSNVGGTNSITSTALRTLTLTNLAEYSPLGDLNAAVGVTVNTGAIGSALDHTFTLNISGDTSNADGYGNLPTVTDNNAAVFNVIATGGSNQINVASSDTVANSGIQYFNLTNNGTGTLTLAAGGVANSSASPTVITVAGSGNVTLGSSTASVATNAATLTSINAASATGNVTAYVDAATQAFTGGSGANKVYLKDNAGGISTSINGGTGTNNTVVLKGVAGHYASNLGAGITGFQNVQLGAGSSGTYAAGAFSGQLIVGGSTTSASSFGFTGAATGQTLSVQSGSPTQSLTGVAEIIELTKLGSLNDVITFKYTPTGGSASTIPYTVGAGDTTIALQAAALATAINAVLAGSATASGSTVVIAGSDNVGATVTPTLSSGATATLTRYAQPTTGSTFVVSAADGVLGNLVKATVNGVTVTYTEAALDTAAKVATGLAKAINAAVPGVVAAASGDSVTVTGVNQDSTAVSANGGTLQVINNNQVVSYANSAAAAKSATNALPLIVGGAATTGVTAVVSEANQATLNITSASYSSSYGNTLTVYDTTAAPATNNATAINVSGSGPLTLRYAYTGDITGGSALATVDASKATGTVNTTQVGGATTGMTITGGSAALTAFGSGIANGETAASYYAATDVITTGAGGGTITIGYAGAGLQSGTTTINLGASGSKADTVNLRVVAASGQGNRATVSGFQTTATSATDKLALGVGVAGVTSATGGYRTVVPTTTSTQSAAAYGGTATYTVANGVITFSGSDNLQQLITNARGIVDASSNGIAAFVSGGSTYVVVNNSGGTSSGAASSDTDVITLQGVIATQIGGTSPAVGSIFTGAVSSTATYVVGASAPADASTTSVTKNVAGYSVQALSGTQTSGATHTYNNMAPSSIVNVTADGTFNLVLNHAATSGNSDTINVAPAGTAGVTLTTLTVTGDTSLTIRPTRGGGTAAQNALEVTTLIDPGNTLTSLVIAKQPVSGSPSNFTLGAVNDTALTSIVVTSDGINTFGSHLAPLSQAALSVTLGSNPYASGTALTANNAVYLSGAGARITAYETIAGTLTLEALGAGSTVTVYGNAVSDIKTGAGSTVTIGQHSSASSPLNANTQVNTIQVGAGSTVTLPYDSYTGNAVDAGSLIKVYTVATPIKNAVAGATSAGTFTFVTVNNAVKGSTDIGLYFASGATDTVSASVTGEVNVSGAKTLGEALDIAAASTGKANNVHYYDWFAYEGANYILSHTGTGAYATGLSANDVVIKLVGVQASTISAGVTTLDLSGLTVSGHVISL